MKARRGILCRNDGVIYLQIFVEGVEDSSMIELVNRAGDGSLLPGFVFHLDGDEYVAMVPEFDRDMTLTLSNRDASLSKIVASFRLNRFFVKWISRFNYRFRKREAFRIRDSYALTHFSQRPFIRICSLAAGGHESVVNGAVVVPQADLDELTLCVRDQHGSIEGHAMHLERRRAVTVPGNEDIAASLFPFFLNVPRFEKMMCLDASAPNPEASMTFLVIPEYEHQRMIDEAFRMVTCASIDAHYQDWLDAHRASSADLERQRNAKLDYSPMFSLVVPLFHTPLKMFEEMAESVLAQSYENWELILVNSTSEDEDLAKAIRGIIERDSRVKLIELDGNLGITGNTNRGIDVAQGEFVAFFDHDDLIEPDILYEYACALNQDPSIDALYCDEDKVDENGKYIMPFFKPDFNVDQLRNSNYVCHMLTIRKDLLDKIGRINDGYDGAQDHYTTLRVAEESGRIHHVPRMLYHWRAMEGSTALDADGKAYAGEAGLRAVRDSLDRQSIDAEVEPFGRPFTYRVHYAMPEGTRGSIVIPFQGNVRDLDECLSSIISSTGYSDYEIVVVGGKGTDDEASKCIEGYSDADVTLKFFLHESADASLPQLVNLGVSRSAGDFLVILSESSRVVDSNWFAELGGMALRDHVGAVGPRILNSNGTYHHAGFVIGGRGFASLFEGMKDDPAVMGYMAFNDITREVSAVGGDCLAVAREAFDAVGGYDGAVGDLYCDVDFCLRLREAGYNNIYTSNVLLRFANYEPYGKFGYAIDCGSGESRLAEGVFSGEGQFFRERWSKYFIEGDPFYNVNLSQRTPGISFFALSDSL